MIKKLITLLLLWGVLGYHGAVAQEGIDTNKVVGKAKNAATLRFLNKLSVDVVERTLPIRGDIVFNKTLRVQLFACLDTGTDQLAFLQIWSSAKPPKIPGEPEAVWERNNRGEAKVFSGWMFASSPGLNALDDPIYDVWLVRCS